MDNNKRINQHSVIRIEHMKGKNAVIELYITDRKTEND